MKELFMKTLSVMLLGMTMTAVISCTDNNDNEVTPVPNTTMANLEGKWIIDMDGESDLDYYFLTLNFDNDKKAEIGLTIYDYDSDSYEQESITGRFRPLSDEVIDGRSVSRVELTLDNDPTESESADDEEITDTLYFSFEGGKAKMLLSGLSQGVDADEDGNIEDFASEMTRGELEIEKLNKQYLREVLEWIFEFESDENDDADEPAHARTRGENINYNSWMEKVPNDKLVRNMLLPGAHDAGTCGMDGDWGITLGKTQRKSLLQQWDCGIRYFDLRTRYRVKEDNNFIFHSMLDCNMSLYNAITDIAFKLQQHKETDGVVISIKPEGNDAEVNDSKAYFSIKLPKLLGGDQYVTDIRKYLEVAGNIGIYKFDFYPLYPQTTIQYALRFVEELLLDKGLLAKWTPDMTMADLRGKAVVKIVNDVKDVEYGRLADYVVIENNDELYTPSKSAKAKLVEQNIWEAPSGKTYYEYVKLKCKEFGKLCAKSKDQTQDYWVSNAANGYDYECYVLPNYAKFASHTYGNFCDSIKNNPGCRGVVLLDYAGDNAITRVNIYRLATGAVFSYAIGGWCETIISLFRKRPNQLTLFKASYSRLENRTSAYYTRSQELVEELVAGNFRQ